MKIFFIVISILSLSFFSYFGYSQSVTFNVTTVTDNGNFSPKHILAIWVEDANGAFVKSIKVNAATRIQYLYSWNANSGGNKVDAITGATLPAHQSHTVTWNCKNTSNSVVPNGNYKMLIEYTDQHAQGPIYSLAFTISGTSQHLAPTDQSYFKNISLDFNPVSTGISDNIVGNQILSVYPNPNNGLFHITLTTEEKSLVTLRVVNIKGAVIHQEQIQTDKLINYPIQLSNYSRGTYILELTNNKKSISQKLTLY